MRLSPAAFSYSISRNPAGGKGPVRNTAKEKTGRFSSKWMKTRERIGLRVELRRFEKKAPHTGATKRATNCSYTKDPK